MSAPATSEEETARRPTAPCVRAGEYLFPWRTVLGVIAVGIGAWLVRPVNVFGSHATEGTVISFLLVAAGLALRAWAAACAGGHTRGDRLEAPGLVTGGPYAFVRNPIYLGSFILGLGMVGLLGDPWLMIPHLLVFAVFFGMIVPAEEKFLERKFGNEYRHFRDAVPRILPALSPWKGGIRPRLNWRAAQGDAVIALALLATYAAFRGVLWLKAGHV